MVNGRKRVLNLAFLSLFLFITLFFNFLHTEKTLTANENCPACQFQNSSLTTSQIHFAFLPQPSVLGLLKTVDKFHYNYISTVHPASRSPPQI